MSDQSFKLISAPDQWQRPVAILLWSLLVLGCIAISIYAFDRTGKGERRPTGEIDGPTGLPKFAKETKSYPLILAFAVGGLALLLPAAISVLICESIGWGGVASDVLGDQDIQAVSSALIGSFYAILTGWLLTETAGSRSLVGLFRGKGAAAFLAGFLMAVQVALSLTTLYFYPYSGG